MPLPAASTLTYHTLAPHFHLWHWGVFVYLGQERFFLGWGYTGSVLPLFSPSRLLLPTLFAQGWPRSLILKNTQLIYFPCVRQPKAFKDNDNLSTAILSCKEFARFAGTGSYRNILLVLCGLDSQEGQGYMANKSCENNYTTARVAVAVWRIRKRSII